MVRLVRLWRLAASDLRLLWFALRHPDCPVWLLPATLIMGFYALEPLNFVVPLLGVLDDFILLPLLLNGMLRFLPREIRADFGAIPGLRNGGG